MYSTIKLYLTEKRAVLYKALVLAWLSLNSYNKFKILILVNNFNYATATEIVPSNSAFIDSFWAVSPSALADCSSLTNSKTK